MIGCVKKCTAFLLAAVMLVLLVPVQSRAVFADEDKIVIVLDPGHGGYDPGASGNGVTEEKWSLEVAKELKRLLEENGNFIVYMTRSTDTYLSIGQRGVIANQYNADLLFSIHFDASESRSYRGASFITSVLPEYAVRGLGNKVLAELKSQVGLPTKGIIQRRDNAGYYWNAEKQWDCQDSSLGTLSDYYGIPTWGAKFGFPAVIVEHGFVSNKADTDLLKKATAAGIAKADADALISYYTNHTHTYESAPTVDYPSNCYFTGKQSVKCTTCGHRKGITSLAADPDNHYWVNETSKKPTCGEDGYLTHECRITLNLNDKGVVCDNHKETIHYEAEPHDYKLIDSKEVTHAADGYSKYKCSKCGDSYTDVVKCEGHTWYISQDVKPTCTEKGKIVRACRGCTETKTETVDALGHTMKYTVEVEPTCVDEGKKVGKCSVCKATETEAVKPLGHTLTETVTVEPTCLETGLSEKTCSVCDHKEETEIKALGHNKGEDGICLSCGEVLETTPVTETETEPERESVDINITAQAESNENGAGDDSGENGKKSHEVLAVMLVAAAAALAILFIVIRAVLAKKAKNDADADEPDDDAEDEESPAEEPEKEETEV